MGSRQEPRRDSISFAPRVTAAVNGRNRSKGSHRLRRGLVRPRSPRGAGESALHVRSIRSDQPENALLVLRLRESAKIRPACAHRCLDREGPPWTSAFLFRRLLAAARARRRGASPTGSERCRRPPTTSFCLRRSSPPEAVGLMVMVPVKVMAAAQALLEVEAWGDRDRGRPPGVARRRLAYPSGGRSVSPRRHRSSAIGKSPAPMRTAGGPD